MDTGVCKFKCNSMIFLLKNFQNVIKARVTCLRTHFIPLPPHKKKSCMKPWYWYLCKTED